MDTSTKSIIVDLPPAVAEAEEANHPRAIADLPPTVAIIAVDLTHRRHRRRKGDSWRWEEQRHHPANPQVKT
ncbi:hypothetical protein Dimus_026121, partial [Dionaea muscipula]